MIKTIVTPNGCENVEMTPEEETAFLADQAQSEGAIISQNIIASAQSELDKSDMVAIRCFKSGVEFPDDWKQYVASLRAIVNIGTGDLPIRPNFPSDT